MVDEQKPVENGNDGEQPIVAESPTAELKATPEVETPTTETPNVEAPVEEAQPEVSKESDEPRLKPVEKRIHKLVDKVKDVTQERDSLAKQVEALTFQLSGQGNTPYTPTIAPGAEVTEDQYKADVVRTAQSIAQLEVSKQRLVDTINREATESMQDHPELNPKSEVYDPELSEMVTASVMAQVQNNPSASVRKLVNNLMKPYRRAVEKKVAETQETITKQVSETALRPSGVKVQPKKFEDLSIAEMEAQLGKVY